MNFRAFYRVGCVASLALTAVACSEASLDEFQKGDPPTTGPGSDPWLNEERIVDPSCTTDNDCLDGETCVDNVCQMQRCTTYGESAAPLGDLYAFFWEREFLVSDQGTGYLDVYDYKYDSVPPTLDYERSWHANIGNVADIVGGNFLPEHPDEMAVAQTGSNILKFIHGENTTNFDLGFAPIAITKGDFDHNYLDEVFAVGANGEFARCNLHISNCELSSLSGVNVYDVAAGDLDADGYDEVVVLMDASATRVFYILNLDYLKTGQDQVITAAAPYNLSRIDAGDLDNNGTHEVFGLEEGTPGLATQHQLAYYRLEGTAMFLVQTTGVAMDTVDLTVGDIDGNSEDEVTLVRSAGYIDAYKNDPSAIGSMVFAFSGQINITGNPNRIAMVDDDENSPRGRLIDGPIPVPGKVIPTMLLQLPPYNREYSNGVSSVGVGSGSSTSTSYGESVGINMGVELGVGAGLFGLFGGGVSRSMGENMGRSEGVSSSMSIGDSHGMGAAPQQYGYNQAGIVLTAACFLNFIYEIDDPKGIFGGNGKPFSLLVPVGGQTALWDVRRYNAMAAAVGYLPQIPVHGFRSGELDTYPTAPMRADGSPIPANDLVFANPPEVAVSDTGSTSWSVSVGQGQSNSVSLGSSISVGTGVSASLLIDFEYGEGVGQSWGRSYSVGVGSSTSFSGSIPAIPNQPGTPEDEYLLFRYTFRPYVYRQPYTDGEGNDGFYYAITYAVGQ